eukprot:Skav232978  [mRNA]  locus=scaffold1735:471507:473685:+ [translate_table: standard]
MAWAGRGAGKVTRQGPPPRLALLVHPDKCSEIPEAKAAFQKLSEAFEHLVAAADAAQAPDGTGPRRGAKRKREKPWWDVPTWEEWGLGLAVEEP